MAVYTDITDEELAAFLADFDLGQALAFKGIAEGMKSAPRRKTCLTSSIS
jgi:homoserine kinase type II